MNSYNIIYKKRGKYSAIVYPVSYINPLDDIQMISLELQNHLPGGTYVLFDLLLSNGDNFNRFAEARFNGRIITKNEVNITSLPIEEVDGLNKYYRGRTKELSRSILSKKDRFRFATMK